MTTIIENLVKRFDQTTALKKINVTIEDGEFIAILGPSGCGKTTLLRLLAGFDAPSSGNISIGDQRVSDNKMTLPPEKRNIGMVFQSFALWPHLNVRKHIEFPLLHHAYVPKDASSNISKRVDEVMEIIELTELANRMPSELSGGQKQRVALGRAIAPKPELLLMDEPLSNLDAELRMEMRKEIQELHRMTNATIVYVTHDQGEALAMADRIVVMNKGEIEQIGTPQEIYSRPNTSFVANFVGKANLIDGIWEADQFTPASNPDLTWPDLGVSVPLKKQGIYPVRPEQLTLMEDDREGIHGVITSVQYQGKEIHYTVQANGQAWLVHTDILQKFQLGQQVKLQLKVGEREANRNVVYL
ncbi:ABC transporter ATP-binding protein [Gracilibacillus massiliensis]|uniref:ABC transporter ATP-binding protein n=1 Tax=Gracilibacillus massiliensis TaxID=1564956 RepID=UPI00071E1249|nr:ABC transporter ATP-binding protein [Gracilibacillus massiliensis]